MIELNSLLNIFDVGDLKFFLLVVAKKFKKLNNTISNNFIVSFYYFIKSRKKYLSKATIVIEPDDNKIVNIEEVYSIEAQSVIE